ncbi:MAG: hypothetical protein BWY85_01238 [Firmicutes bacterium ADurb.Bin506]|nr:MAG: hypothetical protein BWY85_01238 [Firmicutes bacterium ADurb.Bin506]
MPIRLLTSCPDDRAITRTVPSIGPKSSLTPDVLPDVAVTPDTSAVNICVPTWNQPRTVYVPSSTCARTVAGSCAVIDDDTSSPVDLVIWMFA